MRYKSSVAQNHSTLTADEKSFSKLLIKWYKKHARDLPWRKTKDPYKIWISEVMLQQTTVSAVIPYYENWIKIFPNVESVARAPLQKVLKVWQGLGYYTRAKNIHASSQVICKEFNGQIPSDPEVLRKFPGFGPYTIGAVLSIAFNQRRPVIDANVRRVVMRLQAIKGFADPSQDTKVLGFLDKIMPNKEMNLFNQALMELGALVCRNREPRCLVCPVKEFCQAYQKGIQELIPTPKRTIIKEVHVAIAVIEKNGKFFIQKRPSNGLFADLWEFPGGKIEKGESPQEALQREIKEELGVRIQSSRPLMNVQHYYTQFRANLKVFACSVNPLPKSDASHKWVPHRNFTDYPMPSGSAKIVERLMGKL